MKLEDRKNIIDTYATLINLVNKTEPNTTQGELIAHASACSAVLDDMPQKEPIDEFLATLNALSSDADFKPACARLATELAAMEGLWLYERAAGDWEIYRYQGDDHAETMVVAETEGLVDRIISLFDTPDQAIPVSTAEEPPVGFRIEENGETWDCYRNIEDFDNEDDDEIIDPPEDEEIEEEWFATVNTETMAILVCESMAGMH